MHYTDSLIREFITEEYKSQAAANETERKAAEDAYNTALKKTGDPVRRTSKYGGVYDAPAGTFDLDNFHKAYDKWYEDNDLLHIFNDEGKYTGKRIWPEIAGLDRTLPEVRALLKLFGVQFKGDIGGFTADWNKRQDAENARQAWYEIEGENTAQLKEELTTAVMNYPEWKNLAELVKVLDKNAVIEPDITVYTRNYETAKNETVAKYLVAIQLCGIVIPDTDKSKEKLRIIISNVASALDIEKDVKQLIKNVTDLTEALINVNEDWKDFLYSPIGELLNEEFVWICFFNEDDGKFYEARRKDLIVSDKMHGKGFSSYMIIHADDDEKKVVQYSRRLIPVVVTTRSEHDGNGDYKHWESAHSEWYFTTKFGEDILKKHHISTKEESDSIHSIEIKKAEPPFDKFFEFHSVYDYFCDSSD